MQVLGWQCYMLRKHGLDYEDELDVNLNSSDPDPDPDPAATPGSLEEMSPMVSTPTPGAGPPEAGVVLAGFRDCSEEAVRYLVEVEHLEEDDPLVVGLRRHLWERQQYLDVPRLLEEQGCGGCACGGCGWGGEGGEKEGYHQRNYQIHHQQHQQHQYNTHRPGGEQGVCGGHHAEHQRLAEAARWRLQAGAADTMQTDSTTPTAAASATATGTGTTTTTDAVDLHLEVSSSPSLRQSHSHSQPLEEGTTDLTVLDLALLAQNNPAIASLTEEILSLLGGASDSDLDESDFDFDMDHSSE